MKTLVLFIVFIFSALFTFSQIDPQTPWTWMKGDNTVDQPGIYGTQNIAASSNKPGARNFSTTWRDTSGHLWLFGGMGYSATTMGYLNDLWKYNPSNNQWTWMKGDNSTEQYSVYGTQGTAHTANKPGAIYASVSWTDANNNLWLFGGFGYTDNNFGFLNTLWKYNPSTNQWIWIKGDDTIDKTGVYGTKGLEDNINKPGARYGSLTWTDADDNLWLFGGYGYDSSSIGILNDLWRYNPSTNKWAWIHGDKAVDQKAVYGTKGVAAADNKPGALYVSTSWTDNSGNMWLFGGFGYDETSAGNLNDIWRYNPSSNKWTWISGDKTINQNAVYGTQGLFNAANKPGSRYVSSSWVDNAGELWLFGGYGYDGANAGYLNDLWKYSPASNGWTWVKGDNTVDQPGIYGTQGLPDTSNKSGARTASVSWTDGNGNLWLFGGYGYDGNAAGILNDLWKISSFQVPLPLQLLHFSGTLNNTTVCLKWEAEEETAFSHFNVHRSFDGINFSSIGLINGAGNNNRNSYSYTDSDLKNHPVKKVFYRLQMVDMDGKFKYSKVIMFDLEQTQKSILLFPNPVVTSLTVSFNQEKEGNTSIRITDMKGTTVRNYSENIPAGKNSMSIDASDLPSATYILSVIKPGGVLVQQKFIRR